MYVYVYVCLHKTTSTTMLNDIISVKHLHCISSHCTYDLSICALCFQEKEDISVATAYNYMQAHFCYFAVVVVLLHSTHTHLELWLATCAST